MYLGWETSEKDYYVVDIETDDLKATLIHVMCWKNVKTGEVGECTGLDQIRSFFERTAGSIYIGQNILKFDAPVLVRLTGVQLGINTIIDTLVLSTLYNPSLPGGHSLDAWGERLGREKIKFDDFSRLTPEMITYCHRDVEITCELFKKLTKVLFKIGFSEKSIWIQHRFTVILDRQHRNGFYFDGQRAIELLQTITNRRTELEENIHEVFPPSLEELDHYKRAYKQDGNFSAGFIKHRETYERVDIEPDGSYKVFGRTSFNIGSPQQRTQKLLDLGWVPEEFTEKTKKGGGGNPQPFVKGELSPSLERFVESGSAPKEVRAIAKWMALTGRINKLKECLDGWDEDDGCIHGKLFVANTLRLRHQSPNTANIPAVRVEVLDKGTPQERMVVRMGEDGYYTYESRDLWCARPGRVLVGTDAKGLELRMLAHYLNRADFTKQVIEGDPHQYNADMVGVPKPTAKTLLYAIQYGAQVPKVATILKCGRKEAARIREEFLERLGLKEVMNDAIAEQERGRIELVDGSKIICPFPHSALNYRLQGGGARVMALGAIFLEGHIRRNGLDSLKVGDIHDEWQYDVHPSDALRHGELAVQSLREAGEELNLNVPLDGTSKEGLTWAETH